MAIASVAACGDSEPAADADSVTTDAPVDTVPVATPAVTAATNPPPDATDPPTTAGRDWREDVTAVCDHFGAAFEVPEPDGTPDSVVDFLAAHRRIHDTSPQPLDTVGVSADSPLDRARQAASATQADEYLTTAEQAAAAGDVEAAFGAFEHYLDQLGQFAAGFLIAGAPCASDPSRAAGASLNVSLANQPAQLEVGFDSVWVSAGLGSNEVLRIDPDSGEILAIIDVGAQPVKLQPADGRLWVRTADSFVAIDPASNTVSTTLMKADVGPAANRSWAVDGAMWICDGQRLHRYDPTTVQPVTAITLDIECGNVHAAADLVVAWSYNEDDGQSGTSAAAFIDPATNQVMATVPLPVDVTAVIMLDDSVFLPGNSSSTAVVVDRATWAITATPDLGHPTRCSLCGFDGTSIYIPTDDSDQMDVLVVDGATFEVIDTIETLGANSVSAADGALWVVDDTFGVLQRFEIN